MAMGSENGTPQDDEIAQLRHERNLLAKALGELVIALGYVRTDAAMTGPELVMVAEQASELAIQERADTSSSRPARVYVSVERGVPDIYVDGTVSLVVADFDREGEAAMGEEEIASLFTPDMRTGTREDFDKVVSEGRASFAHEFGHKDDGPGLSF